MAPTGNLFSWNWLVISNCRHHVHSAWELVSGPQLLQGWQIITFPEFFLTTNQVSRNTEEKFFANIASNAATEINSIVECLLIQHRLCQWENPFPNLKLKLEYTVLIHWLFPDLEKLVFPDCSNPVLIPSDKSFKVLKGYCHDNFAAFLSKLWWNYDPEPLFKTRNTSARHKRKISRDYPSPEKANQCILLEIFPTHKFDKTWKC